MPHRFMIYLCHHCVLLEWSCIYVGTCQNLDILMAQNASTGIQIILTSTKTTNSSPINITIADHYLPPECGVNHLCGILQFGQNKHKTGGKISHYIVPLIGGFMMLSVDRTNEELLPQRSVVNVTENCNPTRAFLARNNHITVACMNLQTRPRGILHYLSYEFIPNSVGSGSIVRDTDFQNIFEPIYSPETISEIIHVRGQARCPQNDNLYFIDDAFVLQFPTSDRFDPDFVSSGPLQNCVGYQSFEYYGNDSLIIRCANNRTALYDSCGGHFTYPPPDRVPYPCTNWNSTIAYRNRQQLTLKRDGEYATQQLSSNDLSYGRCVEGVDHPTFIASSADGSVSITPFNSSDTTKIICNGTGATDHRPILADNGRVLGVFDESANIFKVVNLAVDCEQPVTRTIQIPENFVPDLITISRGVGEYHCGCETAAIQNSKNDVNNVKKAEQNLPVILGICIPVIVVIIIVAAIITT